MATGEGGEFDEQQAWEEYRRRQEPREYVDYEERIVPQEIIERFLRLLVRKVKIQVKPNQTSGTKGPKNTA